MRRRLNLLIAFFLLATSVASAPVPARAAAPTLPPVLAALRDGTVTRLFVDRPSGVASAASVASLASALSGISLSPMVESGALFLRLPRALGVAEARTLAEQLSADPRLGSVVPDAPLYASVLPDDPNYADQAWHYDGPNGVNRAAAEGRSDGTGVVVAVVDTGITAHPDLVTVEAALPSTSADRSPR